VRQAVRDVWLELTGPLEGAGLTYPYADVLGLVTIAYGNLIDPVSIAMGLPFVHHDGRPARGDEIASDWWKVKNDPFCRTRGHRYAKTLTEIRLTKEGVERLVYGQLEANDRRLESRFPAMQDWPAMAILAVHSLSWACGPHFNFPDLVEALRDRDFAVAAGHIHINEWSHMSDGTRVHNKGLIPRNVMNKILMRNAARVDAFRLDPDLIDWKHDLTVSDVDTAPELPAAVDATPIPVVISDSRIPPRPSTAADQPTVGPRPILRADPSAYLRPDEWLANDPSDDDDAA